MSISVETYALAKKYTDEHGGGGGGTTNYNQLTNKPKINGVTVEGEKSFEDYGFPNLSESVAAAEAAQQGAETAKGQAETFATQSQQSATQAGESAKVAQDAAKQALGSVLPSAADLPDGYILQTKDGQAVWGESGSNAEWETIKDITAGQEITGNWIILNINEGIKLKKFALYIQMFSPTEDGHTLTFANAQINQLRLDTLLDVNLVNFSCVPTGDYQVFMCFGQSDGEIFWGKNQYPNNNQPTIYDTISAANKRFESLVFDRNFAVSGVVQSVNIYFNTSYCGADTRVILLGVRDESV